MRRSVTAGLTLLLAVVLNVRAQTATSVPPSSAEPHTTTCDCQEWKDDWKRRYDEGKLSTVLLSDTELPEVVPLRLNSDCYWIILPELLRKFPGCEISAGRSGCWDSECGDGKLEIRAEPATPPVVDCNNGVTASFLMRWDVTYAQSPYRSFAFQVRVDVRFDPRDRFHPRFPLRSAKPAGDAILVARNIDDFDGSTLNNAIEQYLYWLHVPDGPVPDVYTITCADYVSPPPGCFGH
jgi:hypothetical protein